jgi:hypothetical protein
MAPLTAVPSLHLVYIESDFNEQPLADGEVFSKKTNAVS